MNHNPIEPTAPPGIYTDELAADHDIVLLQVEFASFEQCLGVLRPEQRPAAIRYMSHQVREALTQARDYLGQQLSAREILLADIWPKQLDDECQDVMQVGDGI